MRLAAYVMAGDPAWATQSVASYYDMVDRIVVSYDVDGLSWAGHPMEVDATIARMLAVDRDHKLELLPGRYAHPGRFTLDIETEQRQEALQLAGKDVDWVLQLDSDEVALAPARLAQSLVAADAAGAAALDYPLRHAYQRALDGRLLEHAQRGGGARAGYPGPLAIRSGTILSHCRQADVEHFRVDIAPHNTDPARAKDLPVHAVISEDEAVLHLSWVRTEEQMRAKSKVSGHADNQDWDAALRRWRWSARHPRLAVATGRFSRDSHRWLRVVANPVGDGDGDWFSG